MQGPKKPSDFYSFQISAGSLEDDELVIEATGYEEDIEYDGEHQLPRSSSELGALRWFDANRSSFPPFIPQDLFSGIAAQYAQGPPEVVTPKYGLYFIITKWSGPSVAAEKAMVAANAARALPRPLFFLESDSREVDERFPHLMGLLTGKGELFGFSDGNCDLFFQLGDNLDAMSKKIETLYSLS